MKPFNNYAETQALSETRKLPKGGYIVRIMGAEVKEYSWGQRLEISIDISEGEYKDFYAADYRSQTGEDKKWKGVLRLSVPTDDGSEKDDLTKRIFKGNIEAVEDSNSGYHWDWDEKKLKGKTVGCIFRNEEWEIGGRSGWKSQPYKFIPADKIRSGDFKIPDDKAKSSKTSSGSVNTDLSNFEEITTGNSDLPFDI